MRKFRITSLRGNKSGDNFKQEGCEVGDIVTEKEVENYIKKCRASEIIEIESFNRRFSTQIEEIKEDKMKNSFTKDDLRLFDVLVKRNGDLSLVVCLEDGLQTSNFSGGGNPFSNLNYDLTNMVSEVYDVVKVYRADGRGQFGNFLKSKSPSYLNLIWERNSQSPIELEIEKLEKEKREYDEKFNSRLEELRKQI